MNLISSSDLEEMEVDVPGRYCGKEDVEGR